LSSRERAGPVQSSSDESLRPGSGSFATTCWPGPVNCRGWVVFRQTRSSGAISEPRATSSTIMSGSPLG
jgi:hypothetical protein